jgi:transposase
MPFSIIIGVDSASEKFDWHALDSQEVELGYAETKNTSTAIQARFTALCVEHKVRPENVLICIENTGLYSLRLAYELYLEKFSVWMEDAFHLNHSIGRVKGKTDRLDAYRIAKYAVRNTKDFSAFVPNSKAIAKVKTLMIQRKRMVKAKNLLMVPINEERKHSPYDLSDSYEETDAVVELAKSTIKALDKKIDEALKTNPVYSKTYAILQSLPAIGPVTARLLITKTNNFANGYEGRKLCSLVGVAPFPRESGKCLKKRPSNGSGSDRELKSCLYLGMLRQIKMDNKMSKYYASKIAQGKHHNSVINAMANKILHAATACLRKGVMYDENYTHKLA